MDEPQLETSLINLSLFCERFWSFL